MQDAQEMFDIVRLVDPDNTAVISFQENRLIRTELEPCFKVWNKEERCENCVSRSACVQKVRMTKFEYRDNEMYSVIAMPFLVKDEDQEYLVSLELVNYVSENITVNVTGGSLEKDAIELVNYKIYKDSLTGIYNRRYFDERQFLIKMRIQNGDRIGFIMVDVNRFKHVNDYYGHANGDELLYHVATTLRQKIRNTDCVIRIGGDEFIIVLSNCSKLFMEKKIQELKHAISKLSLPWMEDFKPSIAAGMSYTEHFTGEKEQFDEMFQTADDNMYANKNIPMESKKAMLIVDDIEVNRVILKEYFAENFDVFEAADGIEGLHILHENSIEVVISDINMPNMNGLEMIKKIRKDPEINKIIVFAITDQGEEWELKALDAGADDFINKPFQPELLSHRIQGVLAQNTISNRISQY